MAHRSSIHGQPSPPHSIQEKYLSSEYNPSPMPASKRPYTPPTSHPAQDFTYGDPEEYEVRHAHEYYEQPTFYRTPPQPIGHSGMQTRSGRSLGTPMASNSPSSRHSASPRGRKHKRGKGRQLEEKISEPLSVMTKDYDIPVEDMVAWVNRPNQDRWDEVRHKHKNKIPRPMNSFMLYRRAYKERIKKWGAQGDNNQLISSVAGISWNMETEDIKNFYSDVAKVEAHNHALTFPDYKFAPNKNTKKRDRDDDDSDGEWEGSSSYSGKRRRGRRDRDITRSRSTTPAQVIYGSPFHPSSYQASNSHLIPVMSRYDQWVQPIQYGTGYQYGPLAYHHQPFAFHCASTSAPSQQDQFASELVGLPPSMDGSQAVDQAEIAMDPTLAGCSANYEYGSFPEEQPSHNRSTQLVYEGDAGTVDHPGLQTLAPADQMWSPTGIGYVGGAFDAELNRWNDEA